MSSSTPYTCACCLRQEQGFGNNPAPLIQSADARCCNECNKVVVFLRMMMMRPGVRRLNRANWLRAIRNDHQDIRRIQGRA